MNVKAITPILIKGTHIIIQRMSIRFNVFITLSFTTKVPTGCDEGFADSPRFPVGIKTKKDCPRLTFFITFRSIDEIGMIVKGYEKYIS